ncbi:MAG: PH domain-containing protein [Ruminococcaceae bacterium]|nr:PH domain-containing protein [Oscillospiraceae bacterium]
MSKLDKLKKTYGEDLLWSGKKCICGLPISFTRYILTSTVLYTRVGFLNVKEDEIELYKIVDKVMLFPLGQRIVGCGSVKLTSKDSDTPEKLLKAIKKPREVKRILDEAVKKQRDKYMIRGRDMMGAVISNDADIDGDDDN